MDLISAIDEVINLTDYISVTEKYANRTNLNLKVPLNTATVLALKKVRSIEIEYFNKQAENGIACTLLQNLIRIPPSKGWRLLAKELIHCLLQYWLDAIRKHLVNHSTHWWMFLSLILKCINDIYLKDPTIPDLLVEFTAECLFELATAVKPDVYQRHEILHYLNLICAASSREVRFAFRAKFADYFIKIAYGISTLGYVPYQYSGLECLMRWLLPRQDAIMRQNTADKWFPRDRCHDAARALFITSTWINFFRDARNFMNALNQGNGLLTSVICRHLTIGQILVINGTERHVIWMDFNTSLKCISVMLEPRELMVFGITGHRACEALIIDDEIIENAVLRREALGLIISLDLLRSPTIRPIDTSVNGQQVTAIISSRTDLRTLDRAMRNTFGDKYQLLLDLDIDVAPSPQVSFKNKTGHTSEEDTRFSHPAEVKRHKHAGYIVRKRKTSEGRTTPSVASASSIYNLKEKLAALPSFPGRDKDPVSVLAEPSLSRVTEYPEKTPSEVRSYCTSETKASEEDKSKSDGETASPKNGGGRREPYTAVIEDNAENFSQTDIEDIKETLPKDFAGESIIDALSREAMLAPPKYDSGINIVENERQEEIDTIVDTPNEIRKAGNRMPYKTPCIVSTTDDESNTEAINDTPANVTYRKSALRRCNKSTPNIEEKHTFDVKMVEEFFSQHVAENKKGEIVISPRLAKKINETSSETSDNYFDDNVLLNEEIHTDIEQNIFNDVSIIDCLNEMVDKVCMDIFNDTENLFKDNVTEVIASIDHQENLDKSNAKAVAKLKATPKTKKSVKKAKTPSTKSKAVQKKNTKKMSTIIEQKEEEMNLETKDEHVEVVKIISPKKAETPKSKRNLTRRKRKLYSPKDDTNEEQVVVTVVQSDEDKTSDEVPLSNVKQMKFSKGYNTTAMPYKEIEIERKKNIRLPRTRKCKATFPEPPSPNTAKKNAVFDSLKATIENNETIRLADKSQHVYNFTSDSEEDDFREKKIEIKKRMSVEPKVRSRNTRRGKGSDTSYEDKYKTKPVKRKTVTKRTTKQSNVEKVPVVDLVNKDLVDEKMREAVREKLNTSIVVEPPTNLEPILEPILNQAPQMEQIQESESNNTEVTKKRAKKTECKFSKVSNDIPTNQNNKETQPDILEATSNDTFMSNKNENKRSKKYKAQAVKKEKGAKKVNVTAVPDNDDRTSSPLPGLLVEESKPVFKDDINDSLNTNMLQKFKKIFRDGPGTNDTLLTQHMLSDVEKPNSSTQNYNNLLDEISFADCDRNVSETAKKQKRKALTTKANSIVTKKDKGEAETVKKQNIKADPTKINKNEAKKKIEPAMDEVIEIQDLVSDRQSDKSIATNSITAHGNVDESPPATESIVETYQPRELQDLSKSMKEYFTELSKIMDTSSKGSVKSNKSKDTDKFDNVIARSPVVSIKRLSLDDISKWIVSQRTSETDSTQASLKIISAKTKFRTPKIAESNVQNTARIKTKTSEISTPVKTRRDTSTKLVKITSSTCDLKSPTVPLPRLSLDVFNKWFPPMPISDEDKNSPPKKPRRELKLIYPTTFKSNVNNKGKRNEKSVENTAEALKPQTIFQTDTNEADNTETNASSIKTRSRSTLYEAIRQHIDCNIEKERSAEPKKEMKRKPEPVTAKLALKKTKISPIKSFGDFTAALDTGNSSNEENPMRTRNSKPKDTIKLSTPVLRKRKSKSPILSVPKKINVTETSLDEILISSSHQGTGESSKKFMIEPKRLFDTMKLKSSNISSMLKDVSVDKSGASSSTVQDWFQRTEPKIDPTLSLRDTVQNVMERLDTTLVEIDHNTSRKFVHLFVEAQAELDALTKQLSKFKDKFKEQALEITRKDCQQRRALVVLLKDEVQAVLDKIDGKKTASGRT